MNCKISDRMRNQSHLSDELCEILNFANVSYCAGIGISISTNKQILREIDFIKKQKSIILLQEEKI